MNGTRRYGLACLVMVLGLGLAMLPATLRAGDQDGITVYGTATIHVKPNIAEIVGIVSADAELASDARVKFTDARKKAVDAIQALHEPGLTLKPTGPSIQQGIDPISQNQMMQGAAQVNVKQRVMISEELMLVLNDIDKLDSDKLIEKVLKVMDAARDAGMGIGEVTPRTAYEWRMRGQNFGENGAMLTLKVADRSAIEGQAYEKAMADARAKAQRIAELSGVKLGRVMEVVDQTTPQGIDMQQQQQQPNGGINKLGEIPIGAQLMVKFEILPK